MRTMRCIHPVWLCVGVCRSQAARRADGALPGSRWRTNFEAANPNLRAGQLNIQESKASEITAYLRPNPNLTVALDQFQPFNGNPYRPFGARVAAGRRSTICTSGSTSGNCAWKARSRARRSPNRSSRTWSAPCCSTCAPPSCRPCRPRPLLRQCQGEPGLLRQGTGHQPRPLRSPATSRAWTWTASLLQRVQYESRLPDGAGQRAHRQNHAADCC